MKTSLIRLVLASLAGAAAACSVAQVEPRSDPPVVVPEKEDVTPAPDAGADARVAPTSCSPPIAPLSCPTTTPAPVSASAIAKFVKDAAIPLRCGGGDTAPAWDVSPLVELYGAQKIFMVGEVHGTNEIGIMSSIILDQLASKGLVNVVAYELPMDLEESFQRYVDTGSDATAERFIKYSAPNMFGSILTKTARAHVVAGRPMVIGAVDIPSETGIAVRGIQAVATKLTSQAQKDSVLTTLPTSASRPPSTTDLAKANAYFDHIVASKTAICAELSAADCERLVAMTHALWATTNAYDKGGDGQLWFARREEVIYYNLKSKMASATKRMFLHMGAAHTNKHEFSGGSRMAHEYELTKGQVFSVGPAYGDGSVIWYGQDMDLPGDPTTLTSALTDAPPNPVFVSTTRPSAACEDNPFGLEEDDTNGNGKRGERYDGYIHYGKLTSEQRPGDTTFVRDIAIAAGEEGADGLVAAADARVELMLDFGARVRAKERAALRSAGFAGTRGLRR